MKINYFEEDIKFGSKGENTVKNKIDRLFSIILLPYIKQYFFNINPEEQLKGKDIEIPRIDLEIKTRRYKYRFYDDILLEKRTGHKEGWFFTTKSKFVSYGFFNKTETDYLENKAWILNIENCRDFFTKKKLEKYEIKRAYSNSWHSDNYVVPISDFPEDCLIPFPKEYWKSNLTRKKESII